MPTIDQANSSRTDPIPTLSEALPHGLIRPPAPVRERIEQERVNHPPEVFARHEESLLNDWTIGYTFDALCLEVIYRRTPQGPEVLAVGSEEVIAFKKATPLAEQLKLETFLGYP